MGSFIAQELMLARPDLVRSAVLMATRGRHDRARNFFSDAERELVDAGITLPPRFDAKVRVLENFSPKTINDDRAIGDWIEMFTMWPTKYTPGLRTQGSVGPKENRLPAYRSIRIPTLVIGFADDVLLPRIWARRSPTRCRTAAIWRSPTPDTSASSSGRRKSTPRR